MERSPCQPDCVEAQKMTMSFEHKFLLTATAAVRAMFFVETSAFYLKKILAPVSSLIDLYEALRL